MLRGKEFFGDWRVNKERNTNLRKRFKSPTYFSPNHAVKADRDGVTLVWCLFAPSKKKIKKIQVYS